MSDSVCRGETLAGYFEDPVLGQTACVFLSVGNDLADGIAVLRYAADAFGAAEVVMVRLAALNDALEGFADHLYYLSRSDDPGVELHNQGPVRVSRCAEADRFAVEAMLAEAFRAALVAQGRPVDDDRIRAQASSVAQDRDTVSFVAKCEEAVIGHATLLLGQLDELTSEPFVEMLDVLTVPDHEFRIEAEQRLVEAAQRLALSLSQKLVGNIVVERSADGYELKLLRRLLDSGWHFDHKFVIAGATEQQG